MRRKVYFKRFLKVISLVLIIFLVAFFSLNYTINNNSSYFDDLALEVSSKYSFDSDIESVNVYGGYYIVKTLESVVVLNGDYEEVFKESVSKLSDNDKGYDLVYRTNKLMYEDTLVDGDKLVYNYYDAYSYELVSSIELEK